MKALIVKEFRELARDHRTLAMLVVLPVVLLTIFGYAANFSIDRVSVAIIGPEAKALETELADYTTAKDNLDIISVDPNRPAADAKPMLRDKKADVVVVAPSGPAADAILSDRMQVYLDGSSLFTAQAAQKSFMQLAAEDARDRITATQADVTAAKQEAENFQATMEQFKEEIGSFQTQAKRALASGQPLPALPTPPEKPKLPDLPEITAPNLDAEDLVTILFNPDLETSWIMIPGLIGLILTFIGTLITSIGLVRERESGTMEQLAVMPLRPSAIILGKITPYFLLALIDMTAVTALGVWLFGVPFIGSIWIFGLAAVIFCFVVLGIGALISSVSQNVGQAIQLAVMFVVPQVLLSGLIFPLEAMPIGVRWIGYLLPLTWFREIAQGVMLRAAHLDTLWVSLVVLVGMAIFTFGAATVRMRYALTHGGAR